MKLQRSNLKQLNVAVTGGSKGLGKAICHQLKKQNHNVISISRSTNCDVSDKSQLQKVVHSIPNIDIWINNAAQSGGYKKFADQSIDTIHNILQTNLIGTTLACKLVHEKMSLQNSGGTIFNIQGAHDAPHFASYGASKAGVTQLTHALQKEWKNTNVNICLISPGMMRTELLFENLSPSIKQHINFLCSDPEEVATEIVPQILINYYEAINSKITYFKFIPKLPKVF